MNLSCSGVFFPTICALSRMAQFDVYKNNDPRSQKWTPFLLDIQSDILANLATRVVVPLRLYSEEKKRLISKLHPLIEIGDTTYAAIVSELAAIPTAGMDSPVYSVQHARQLITEALDLIFTGF